MLLKNKKTGEIKDVESLGHEKSLRDKYGPQITLSWNTEYENLGECRTYNSLAELNEEWEDYEEPKEYWYIAELCAGLQKKQDTDNGEDRFNKQIGNYFDSREEAEKAVEKLKAWKRLKDKGFRFEYYDYSDRDLHNHIQIKAITNREVEDSMLCKEDLDLLFSQEDD